MRMTSSIRCRMDVGLALAIYRYATEHEITISQAIRYALISWVDRAGYHRPACTYVANSPDAALSELRSYQGR